MSGHPIEGETCDIHLILTSIFPACITHAACSGSFNTTQHSVISTYISLPLTVVLHASLQMGPSCRSMTYLCYKSRLIFHFSFFLSCRDPSTSAQTSKCVCCPACVRHDIMFVFYCHASPVFLVQSSHLFHIRFSNPLRYDDISLGSTSFLCLNLPRIRNPRICPIYTCQS